MHDRNSRGKTNPNDWNRQFRGGLSGKEDTGKLWASVPCPIYLAIFGGTALGGFLRENLLLFILGLTGIFLITLLKGLKLIDAGKAERKP